MWHIFPFYRDLWLPQNKDEKANRRILPYAFLKLKNKFGVPQPKKSVVSSLSYLLLFIFEFYVAIFNEFVEGTFFFTKITPHFSLAFKQWRKLKHGRLIAIPGPSLRERAVR